jgi:hypothetical protein
MNHAYMVALNHARTNGFINSQQFMSLRGQLNNNYNSVDRFLSTLGYNIQLVYNGYNAYNTQQYDVYYNSIKLY